MYSFTKTVLSDKLQAEIAVVLPGISYIDTVGTSVSIYFSGELTSEQQATLAAKVEAHSISSTLSQIVEGKVKDSMAFGLKMLIDGARDNILLGITQAGMTSLVRERLSAVVSCFQTGSLYDAITQLRAIPSEQYDATFITEVRVLAGINKIETFLGVSPLSTEI